jgi:hypothetical protein
LLTTKSYPQGRPIGRQGERTRVPGQG